MAPASKDKETRKLLAKNLPPALTLEHTMSIEKL